MSFSNTYLHTLVIFVLALIDLTSTSSSLLGPPCMHLGHPLFFLDHPPFLIQCVREVMWETSFQI